MTSSPAVPFARKSSTILSPMQNNSKEWSSPPMTRWLRGGEIYIRSKEDELVKARGGIEIWGGLALFFGLTFVAGAAYPAAQDFFNGKTVRIVVGVTAGGGFDAYARAIARHIGR